MTCRVKRDNKGNIVQVLDSQNRESKLFNEISKLPHIESLEDALVLYDEVLKNNKPILNEEGLADKVEDIEGKEETILYSLGNETYKTYNEALSNSFDNSDVQIISNGNIIGTLPGHLDERTVEGLINSLITNKFIQPEKIIIGGETFYQVNGLEDVDYKLNEEALKEYLRTILPSYQYSIKDGLVKIEKPKEIVESTKDSLHNRISSKLLNYFSQKTIVKKTEKVNELNLKKNLLAILNDLGVELITLKEYQNRFKEKSKGVPPSAEAFADIANRIIAYKEGTLNSSNLTEEVMHLVAETISEEEFENLTELIEQSEEYKNHFEEYNKVYNGDSYMLRKEILGKILKNIALNKTYGKEESTIQRFINTIKDFFDKITLTTKHREQLKTLNNLVDRLVIQRSEIIKEDVLAESRVTANLYSLSEDVSSAQESFKKVFSNIGLRQFSSYSKELRDPDAFESKVQSELLGSVVKFVEMSDRLIDTTREAINVSEKEGKSLSGTNLTILEDLEGEIKSNLEGLSVSLRKEEFKGENQSTVERLIKVLDENTLTIGKLRTMNDKLGEDHINKMVNEITQDYGELEGEFFKEQVKKTLAGEIEDTHRLFSYFGQLHNASNPILNMIGRKIWEMNMRANEGTKEDLSKVLNMAQENPQLVKQFAELIEDGYVISQYDFAKFDKDWNKIEVDIFNKITGSKYKTFEEYKQAKKEDEKLDSKDKKMKLSTKDRLEFNKQLREERSKLQELAMSEEYYDELKDKFEGISDITKDFLKNLSIERGAIRNSATTTYTTPEGNKIRRVLLTTEDRQGLKSLSKIRSSRKSIYNDGLLKKGIKQPTYEKPEGESILLNTGQYIQLDLEGLTEQEAQYAQIAYDLNKFDGKYEKESLENNSRLEAFIELLEQKNESKEFTSSELSDLIESNIITTLSSKFYEELGDGGFLKGNEIFELNPNKREEIELLKTLYAKRSSLVSMYRDPSTPFEITPMKEVHQREVQNLSRKIIEQRRGLKLPKSEDISNITEKSINKSYLETLKYKNVQEGTKNELEFLIQNGHTNMRLVEDLATAFNKRDRSIPLRKSEERLLDKYKQENLLDAQLAIARDNIQPYFTRFTHKGYKSIQERLDAGENIQAILIDMNNNDEYIDINVDYSFEDQNNPLKNENFDTEFDGGFIQPKKSIYKNDKYFEKFGIDQNGNATKNKELFEYYNLWIEAKKKGNEKFKETSNPYKVIQISATNTEKIKKIFLSQNKKGALTELFKDNFSYRVDDVAYGESLESNRKLPKYYFNEIEDQNDISTDYIYALAQFVSRANDYNSKQNLKTDIDALYDGLLRSKRHAKRKDLNLAIEMAKSYIDESVYGKVEAKPFLVQLPWNKEKTDVTKLLRTFVKFVTIKNLGFGPIVPATSYLTGKLALQIEKLVGERINRDSYKIASREYRKLRGEGIKNSLDFNDNSKLFLIGQAFGTFDISEKARNAKYNSMERTFGKVPMGLNTMANYEIISKITLSVLYDNKLTGDKIQNRQEYLLEQTRNGIDKLTAENKWETFKPAYDFMDFNSEGFSWKEGTKLSEEYLDRKKVFFMDNVRNEVSRIDMTIPSELRLPAQRNALFSLVLQHKGFLSILTQAKFKKKQFNTATGLIEEGTIRTVGKMIAELFNEEGNFNERVKKLYNKLKEVPKKENFKNDSDFRDAQLEYELRNRNLNRLAKEMSVFTAFAMLVTLALSLTEDEEDENYFYAASNLLMMRVLNESTSSYSGGLFNDMVETATSPIVSLQSAKNIINTDLFSGEEVKSGVYRGLSKRQRYLTKNIPGAKAIYNIWGADNISDARGVLDMYNKDKIDLNTFGITTLGRD